MTTPFRNTILGLIAIAIIFSETPISAGQGQPAIKIPGGPFQPNWASLENFKVPEWYLDAKFGIFIHWGVYSVPAFGSEWYPRQMYLKDDPAFNHHIATYGPQNTFGYKDFISLFKAEKFDPGHWADPRSLDAKLGLFPGDIADVTMLGSAAPLQWQRDEGGLRVKMPAEKPCDHAYVLKIMKKASTK